jgi:hypothetical protein
MIASSKIINNAFIPIRGEPIFSSFILIGYKCDSAPTLDYYFDHLMMSSSNYTNGISFDGDGQVYHLGRIYI